MLFKVQKCETKNLLKHVGAKMLLVDTKSLPALGFTTSKNCLQHAHFAQDSLLSHSGLIFFH
jgi:hypothetical protein